MITVYDKTNTKKLSELTTVTKALVTEERNGLFELQLTCAIGGKGVEFLEKENIIKVDIGEKLTAQAFRICNTRKKMNNRIDVLANHISFDLAFDCITRLIIEKQSCEYVLNEIFRSSQFSKHYRGFSDIIATQNYNMEMASCLESIGGKRGSIIDTFGNGAEVYRDNTNFHVLNKRGHDNGVTVEYRKNLTGMEVEEDTSELITRIFPYAAYTDADGVEVTIKGGVVDSPLLTNYAHPYIAFKDYSDKFDEEETPTTEKLTQLAEREFNNNKVDIPKFNYKIEFIPLSKCVGYEGLDDRIDLCDTVTIIDTRYNIDTQAKVIKTVFNVLRGRYESMELGEPRTSLNDVVGGTSGEEVPQVGPAGPPGPPGADGNIGDFPDSLPSTPVIQHKVYGFGSVELSWTFSNMVYYSYELYASRTKGFTPNTFDLIFEGQASSFLHTIKPSETWYYRVCGVNTHGRRTAFSSELAVSSIKIDDLSGYIENAAIGQALIGELSADVITSGKFTGHFIDARNLSVTDGNGKRTLDIDSFGNVRLDVANLNINSSSVATETYADALKNEAINTSNSMTDDKLVNYTTVTQMESAINLKADEIDLKVSETYEIKGVVDEKLLALKNDVNTELGEVESTLTNMGNYLDGAFKDGILDEQEKETLSKHLLALNSEKDDVISQVETVAANTQLKGTSELTQLNSSKSIYITKHNQLVAEINKLITAPSVYNVTPPPVDFPPAIATVAGVSGYTNQNIVVQYMAIDENAITKHEFSDNDGLSYVTISPSVSGNNYTFTRNYSTAGVRSCKLRLTDNIGQSSTSNTFTINVTSSSVGVTGVTLNKTSHTFTSLTSTVLTPTVTPSNASNKLVSWSSSNTTVATVTQDGTITARANGSCIIVCKSQQDASKYATCSVTVNVAVTPPTTNKAPTISTVSVASTTTNGSYSLAYTINDADSDLMTVELKVGYKDYVTIASNQTSGNKTYNGTGLATGTHTCYLKVSDGQVTATSPMFYIIIPTAGSNQLETKWNVYTNSLQGLRVKLQDAINKISYGQADDLSGAVKTWTQSQINVLNDNIGLKVSQTDYNNQSQIVAQQLSTLNVNVNGISTEVSKKIGANEVVSSINQSAEAVKIQANKIALNGATTIGDASGKHIRLNDANYEIIDKNDQSKAFLGFMQFNAAYDSYDVPKLSMGTDGYASTQNYFALVPFKGGYGNNPENSTENYMHFGYNIPQYKYASKMKMFNNGDIVQEPVRDFIIESHFNNGVWAGVDKVRLARFATSTSSWFNSFLDIGAIVNNTNSEGLVLHDFVRSPGTGVRLYTSNYGEKFLMPLSIGDVYLGSSYYTYKGLYAGRVYTTSGIVADDSPVAINNDITPENAIDNIEFITPFNNDGESVINMDVSKIKHTPLIELNEKNEPLMNETEIDLQ